jgi:hypothetical protein
MDGDASRVDMGHLHVCGFAVLALRPRGELLTDPAMKAAIVGFGDDGDRVLEVIEYLRADGSDARRGRQPCRPRAHAHRTGLRRPR